MLCHFKMVTMSHRNDVINLDAEATLEDFSTLDSFLLECRIQLFLVFLVIHYADSFFVSSSL